MNKQTGDHISMTAPAPPTDFTARGERDGNSKLTTEQVLEIRERYAVAVRAGRRGVTMKQLAREYGISKQQVKNILHRRQWTHV